MIFVICCVFIIWVFKSLFYMIIFSLYIIFIFVCIYYLYIILIERVRKCNNFYCFGNFIVKKILDSIVFRWIEGIMIR